MAKKSKRTLTPEDKAILEEAERNTVTAEEFKRIAGGYESSTYISFGAKEMNKSEEVLERTKLKKQDSNEE